MTNKFELRDYQKRAVGEGAAALLNHQTLGQYPIIQAGTGCWAKGTPVKMADGSTKPIEEISDGDRVLSFDEFSKTITTSTVQSVIKTSLNPKPMIELEYEETCLPSMQDTNNNADLKSKVSTKAGEKDILLGEVRNKGTATSKVRATFDHPFYDGEGFLPLYQLIWGALEESQRVQLKLLCQQYGQTCDPDQKRRKHSCCNESCPRCMRLLQDSDGRQDCKSPSDCSRELVTESYEVPCSESHKWGQSRQPSGESGMVHSSIQCMAWLPLRSDKVEPRVQPAQEAVPRGQRVPERVLLRTHRWETVGDKKNRIQQATENVTDRNKRHNPVLVQWRAKVSPAEPYYAIVLEQAPHTYIVGHGAGFLVHNSGKSLIIAGIVNKLLATLPKPKRESECQIVILQPNKELLEQNSDKLAWYGIDNIAVMSASLNRKEAGRVTMATIGTIKSHSPVFQHVKYVLIDECDAVALTSSSQYVKWLQEVGYPPVLGLTATPYKLRSETLREHGQVFVQSAISLLNRFPPIKFNHKDTFFWGKIIYHYELADLMRDKYLAPIKYYSEIPKATLRLNSTGADYAMDDIETFAVNSWNRILHVVMGALTKHPNRILVFCPSVKSAEIICEELQARKVQAEWVCGATPKKERTDKINRFKSGECKVMLNCMCLTAGFDLPELDCIIYARPTLSPRVWTQAVGRGVRLDSSNPDKVLTVYDLVGLCSTIGPVERIKLRLDRRPNELWSGRGRIDNRSLSKFALKPKLITPPVLNTTLDATGSRVSDDSVKVV